MKEKQIAYAKILLSTCLQLDKNQPLLIIAPSISYEFVRIITDEACKIGVKDIGYYITDEYVKHSLLKSVKFEELKDSPLFNKKIYDEYAKKGAAFLMLSTEFPGLMEDIDAKLMAEVRIWAAHTSSYFEKCREKNELAWLIALVPSEEWARVVYPHEKNALDKLLNTIFELCSLNKKNPEKEILRIIEENKNICQKLNELKIKELHYKNKLGTDLVIGLDEDCVWATGQSKLSNGKEVICNYPSLEVFTTPYKYNVNGIVYSTMPLLTSGVIIDNFSLEFKDGKIVKVHASKNEKLLKEIIKSTENAEYLGEVALVPYDSAIRNQETLFYTTLLDENASCHLAFGNGFTECLEGSEKMNSKQRDKHGLNISKAHVDFMVGSRDLEITALTYEGKEVKIFENGNFTEEIKIQ